MVNINIEQSQYEMGDSIKYKAVFLDLDFRAGFRQKLMETAMVISRRFIPEERIDDKLRFGELEVYKCALLCADSYKLQAIRKRIDKLGILETAVTSPVFLEINPKGISKGSAMKKMLTYYGLSIKEAIAVGDNENDLSMIQEAGLGVAMGNAVEKVKLNYMAELYSSPILLTHPVFSDISFAASDPWFQSGYVNNSPKQETVWAGNSRYGPGTLLKRIPCFRPRRRILTDSWQTG